MKQISSIILNCEQGPKQITTHTDMHAPTATIVEITHTIDLGLYAVSTNGKTVGIYYAEPFKALALFNQIAEYGH